MEDRESGSLSRKPALDLLIELHRGVVTGSLKLERAPLQKAVYFRDGQILFAASNDPKDQLASILVEEGKLGPDQMQVAQARVSPGNPLAKVLTELGYISQRELADAARVKVEKILTDLYTWKEGTYQFATKSLPKGAIDLELSTSRLLFASIRRVQDREWVLRQLGSLETVLTPTSSLSEFISESQPEALAAEVLRLADGVKSVKQIGALSTLGEFEVCKVLAAALVVGAMSKDGASPGADVFSFPGSQESFSFPSSPEPAFGSETIVVPKSEPAAQEDMSYDTVFQVAAVRRPPPPAVEESDKTVFEPPPPRQGASGRTGAPKSSAVERSRPRGSSELLIEEPEPASAVLHGRSGPRPKTRKSGGGGISRSSTGLVKALGAAILVGAALFSVYYFIWPLLSGSGPESAGSTVPSSSSTPGPSPRDMTSSVPAQPLPPGSGAEAASNTLPAPSPPVITDPRAGPAETSSVFPLEPPQGAPVASATSSTPPVPSPSTSTAPRDPRAGPGAVIGTPKPPPPVGVPTPDPGSRPVSGGKDGRALLQDGNLGAAARAFQRELSETPDKFTVALGLYCNEENVGRLVSGASDSSQVYVLPTSVNGRDCYRVIWGIFDSRDAAERSIGSLPGGLRSGDAAPVAVSRFLR